ncbi:MAG: ATP-binding cassette domain-containing protein, partial [Chloroflexota bacterium]|nr:ATP-binding cassette domain-containing protein [Chloroflexota bacterium]
MIRQLEPPLDTPSDPLARLDKVSYRYPEAATAAVEDCSWEIDAGAFHLVVGRSGSGKSTLLRMLNGLVPHFSGGAFGGSVVVCGDSTRRYGPSVMSRHVGFVFQDPEAQVLGSRVDEDIAFALEQRGVAPAIMRKRVEELLDLLSIAPLRHRSPSTLSGGERQRVAIAGALALHPRLLVLDEPTSQLDPWGAEDVLGSLSRLNDDLGLTIVLAEHRLERLLHRVDGVRTVADAARAGEVVGPRAFVERADPVMLPPLCRVGVALGWDPLPLTVKEARRHAATVDLSSLRPVKRRQPGATVLKARGVGMRHDSSWVLHDVDLDLREGELVAIIGRNGSGKTTLLRALLGHHPLAKGSVEVAGTATGDPAAIGRHIGYLPQQPTVMFFADTVR